MLADQVTEIIKGVTPTAFRDAAQTAAQGRYAGSRGFTRTCPVAKALPSLLNAGLGGAYTVLQCRVGADFLDVQLLSSQGAIVDVARLPLSCFPLLEYVRREVDAPMVRNRASCTPFVDLPELEGILARFEALQAAAVVLHSNAPHTEVGAYD